MRNTVLPTLALRALMFFIAWAVQQSSALAVEWDAPGCMDPSACNFDPLADSDDGSCTYASPFQDCSGNCINDVNTNGICDELEIPGCTDAGACNFNVGATLDDGSCTYSPPFQDCFGNCLNDLNANGICDETETGCTDGSACNFDPLALIDDGSCISPGLGVDCFGNCIADTDGDGICDALEIVGCKTIGACNYNFNATDVVACEFPFSQFQDMDLDGYGNAAVEMVDCFLHNGFVLDNTDCNDLDDQVNPGSSEVCNDSDDDCNGLADDNLIFADYFHDEDGDGYGSGTSTNSCLALPNNSLLDGDCDDTNAGMFPSNPETCNGIDDNCDGQIDEGVKFTFYPDLDGDGFGNPSVSANACVQPAGFVLDNSDCDDAALTYLDVDNDGVGSAVLVACGVLLTGDCDDNDANNFPGNVEVCNGHDENCDGQLDEGVTPTWYADWDADGFGDATTAVMQCLNPGGYILDGTDCDDLHWMYVDGDGDGYGLQLSSPVACGVLVATDCNDSQINVNPSVVETCNAIDDNCNGVLDEGLLSTFYADGDQDSFGDLNDPLQACTLPAGYVLNFLDCVPTALTYADNDGDGEGAGAAIPCGVLSNTDCNDNNSSVFSAQTEVCNLQDDNCNFEIDEFVQEVFYADLDLDGFGDINNITIGCSPAPGYTADGQDCNDNLITYEDLDGDTYGSTVWAPCGVTNTLDCDDNDATYSPSFIEWCDGNDNNCNGLIDEGVSQVYYLDLDGDGYGNLATALQACSQPFGYVSDFTDCNDLNAGVNTSAIEVCNGQDDDCDGNADNGVLNTYYLDMDGDGFGDPNQAIQQCFLPLGAVSNALDCDDSSILYEDFDGDGFGSLNWVACNGVYDSSDCHDTLANVYPAQVEVCNGIDDNCNNLIDEGVTTMFFADSDGDGFGDGNVVTSSCSVPSGYTSNTLDCDDTQITYLDADLDGFGSNTIVPCGILDHTDCNDADATLSPSAQEICNSIDDNCNFVIDEGLSITYYADVDGDGFGDGNNFILACSLPVNYVLDTQDCDDNNSNVSPLGTEVCNGIDDNCTGQIDEGVTHWYYVDFDNDGYGGNDSIQACTLPDGYVTDTLDCNDNEPLIYPGGIEGLNGVDDNCDGLIDEGFEFVPDAFSPNGDGQFDQFFIARIHPDEQVKLEIYNRWGIVVYESSDYQNDWDGKGNTGETDGNELSAGTYFYIASFSHDKTVKRGYITLWR